MLGGDTQTGFVMMYINNLYRCKYILNWVLDFRSLGVHVRLRAVHISLNRSERYKWCQRSGGILSARGHKDKDQGAQKGIPEEPGATRRTRRAMSYQEQYQYQLIITLA